jgi:hypothetical protein
MFKKGYKQTEEHKRKISEALKGKHYPNSFKVTHGGSYTRLYKIWEGMVQRCTNPKSTGFRWYGAKQIYIIPKWRLDFVNFRDWALANGYADNLTIDRIDSREGYYPQNCQFITQSENSRKNKGKKHNGTASF